MEFNDALWSKDRSNDRSGNCLLTLVVSLCLLPTGFFSQGLLAQDAVQKELEQNSGQDNELPAAEDVFDDFAEAMGGEMTLLGIESIRSTWVLDKLNMNGQGMDNPVMRSELLWTESDGWAVDSGTSRSGMCDGDHWREISGGEAKWLSQEEADDSARVRQETPFWLARRRDEVVGEESATKVVGLEEFEGRMAWRVVSNEGKSNEVIRFFDKERKFLIGSKLTTSHGPIAMFFKDYREIDGLMYEHKRRSELEHQDMGSTIGTEMKLEEIELNCPIDKEFLAVPDELENK